MTYSPSILRNLARIYVGATPEELAAGLSWYRDASTLLDGMRLPGMTLDGIAGACAAISPGALWERNISELRRLLNGYPDLTIVGTYGTNNSVKAMRCLDGEAPLSVLGGPKVRAFYQCLADPTNADAVVVDRHMKSAANGALLDDKTSLVRPYEYDFYSRHVKHLAKRAGLLPMEYQAIVWSAWRARRLSTLERIAA